MKLLFICTHNRCRSILAEVIANALSDKGLQAYSAGSSPQENVHPLTTKYLSRHGFDTQGLRSQSWDDFENLDPQAVITLCDSAASETCPVWFGDRVQVHWGLEDPSSSSYSEAEHDEKFNATIELLRKRMNALADGDNLSLRGPSLERLLVDISKLY